MTQMIDIEVNDAALRSWFERFTERVTQAQPAMQRIAEVLHTHTDEAFQAQGIPKWQDLADSTKKKRERAGSWPGMILHVTGELPSSYVTDSGPDYARLGSPLPYAAIQNFGGKAGRNHAAMLPARRQIPIDDNQQLIPAARDDILAILADYMDCP